jgi:Polyketide cyclase / dehydrase and lipid transport
MQLKLLDCFAFASGGESFVVHWFYGESHTYKKPKINRRRKFMIKKILLTFGLLLGIAVIYAAVKSDDYLIKRDIAINAKPEAIFLYLSNMKNADTWMPWDEIDSQIKTTYSGPDDGIGSISSWDSPGQMGTGQAEVTSATVNQSVKIKITYTKPMQMIQDSEFILTPEGENTKMTWSVTGKNSFIMRFMCTLMFRDMDTFVGSMFERGLQKLKAKVEIKKQVIL